MSNNDPKCDGVIPAEQEVKPKSKEAKAPKK